jgi:hypothetical protein
VLFGVTTQVDMFTDVGLMMQAKAEMAQGGNGAHADLFSAGTLVTAPGMATAPSSASSHPDHHRAAGSPGLRGRAHRRRLRLHQDRHGKRLRLPHRSTWRP